MKIEFLAVRQAELKEISAMSKIWEEEQITHGLVGGTAADYSEYDNWICKVDGETVGYLTGRVRESVSNAVLPPNSECFEVEELYIRPEWRGKGLGSMLYQHVEGFLKEKGIGYVLLNSATKDYGRIIDFYTGRDFKVWAVSFHKDIR